MSAYQTDALYGNGANPAYLDATSLNPNASGPTDWLTVASQGLQQIVKGKIYDMVRDEQQQYAIDRGNAGYTISTTANGMNLLLVVGVALLLLKD
jgi:hypothetical protein